MEKCKPILSALLTAAMLLSFAACGSTAPAASSTETAVSASKAVTTVAPDESGSDASSEAEDSVSSFLAEESGPRETSSGAVYDDSGYQLPLFDTAESFTAWISFSTSDMNLFGNDGYNANYAVQEVSKRTGVSIDWHMVTSDTNSEQFSLMVAGGDYTDLVCAANEAYSGTMDEGIDDDIFVDIKPYMETCMPYYSAAYDALPDNDKRMVITSEGHIPGTTDISEYNDATRAGAFIRSDYLKAVNKDVPVTYDDLHEVLTAFKSELGLAQPLMLPAGIVPSSDSFCAGYDVNGTFATEGMVASPWYQVDGKVKFGIVEDGYYEYMKMIAGWYKEGLISPDFVEKNNNPMGSDYLGVITSGDAGFFWGENELVTMYMEGTTTDSNFDIQPVSEIVQTEGQTTHFINSVSDVDGKFTVVTTACPDIEKALTFLDYFYSPDGKLYGNMGVEGVSYEWKGDDAVYLDSFLNNDTYNDKERNCIYLLKGLTYLGMDVPDTYTYDIQSQAEDIWTKNDDGAYTMPSVSLTADETTQYSQIYSDISTYMAENLTKFVVGENDLATWDSFVDTLYSMGMQDLIDIYQTALDRYYAIDV